MSVDTNSQSFKENMIAEIKRIQDELNELKNLKINISRKSTVRKPAKKTAKKKAVKRKPAKKTAKKKATRKTTKSKKSSRR